MNRHIRISALVAVTAIGVAFAVSARMATAQAVATEAKTGAVRSATIAETRSGTVKAIDPATRTVTVQTEDGRQVPIQCGEGVRNFDQIKVGDVVKAAAIDRVAVSLGKGSGASVADAAGKGRITARAPEGARPGILVADTEEISAKIESIDAEKRTVALKGPQGRVVPITVGPDVDLAAAKVGDEVTLRVTKGIAMWVEKPGEGALPAAGKIDDGAAAIEAVSQTATVESVDPEARTITLKGESGKTKTIQLGKEVVNFDQIKAGDKVRATLAEAVALSIGKPGEASPAAKESTAVALAPQGGKPGMLITESAQVTGKIESIDADMGTVTLTVDGQPRTYKAGPDVDLSKVKTGDEVTARATKALAIVVEKPESP
jgi:Cu/Ag efflux protein CusF